MESGISDAAVLPILIRGLANDDSDGSLSAFSSPFRSGTSGFALPSSPP